MADLRVIPSKLEVKGAITSNNVAVPTATSTTTLTNKTLTTPTITAPTISGAATMASGATLTTPLATITTSIVTATGTGATDAASVGTVFPVYVGITGATGSGVNLPTGPVGAVVYLGNDFAGVMRVYSNGGVINGTTGTTAFTMTATGNVLATAFCTSATGAWYIKGNT